MSVFILLDTHFCSFYEKVN